MPTLPSHASQLVAGPLTAILAPSGAGQTLLGDFALTRYAPDRTRDAGGEWLFLRDLADDRAWSATLLPLPAAPDRYTRLASDVGVTVVRTDGDVEVTTELCVVADAVVRRYTIANRGDVPRRLELTTYAEVVLNTPAADASHPAFSKLFVQTEWHAEHQALLARRRLRSPDDVPLWLVHRFVAEGSEGAPQFESDRARFLGRGRSDADPHALDPGVALSGTVGNVLDPVVAIRRTVTVPPGAELRALAIIGGAHDRATALGIAERWPDVDSAAECFDAAPDASSAVHHARATPDDDDGAFARALTAGEARAVTDDALAADEPLRLFNGHGGFSVDGREYVIRVSAGARDDALPPLPWVNVVANETVGFVASERGAGTTWAVNSRENRLTPWLNDPVSDPHVEALYLRDDDAGVFWSPQPGPVPGAGAYEVRHGFGYTTWRHEGMELSQEVTQFVPRHDPVKLTRVRITNRAQRPRRLTLASYAQLVLGVFAYESGASIVTERDAETGALLAMNPERGEFASRVAIAALLPASGGTVHATTDRTAFLGPNGTVADPAALRRREALGDADADATDTCAAFTTTVELAPGETAAFVVLLGEAADVDAARALVRRYRALEAVTAALDDVCGFWRELVSRVQIETPRPELDLMVNGWLTYQNLACRVWGRTAFYQSGGAYGFRDQLQDASALVYTMPELTRAQIVLHAAHQFEAGDVLHWWHPPLSKGMRTRFADDLLWLPYITAFYVNTTGDASVLDEEARFVAAPPLAPGEDEVFLVPADAGTSASVYEHCCRSIDRSLTAGAHGLPLMGVGDWNDGMNRVGREGRGESVWLGFFLHEILDDFIPIAERRGDGERVARYRAYQRELHTALNATDGGWDGAWYRRAYYDDGTPLGSASSDECRIDTIAQAWSVISGAAPRDRAEQALGAMEEQLVSESEGLIRLLTPAFDRTPHDPGYIKGYLPGVRENGGQYTHGALWAVRALAELGRCERAAPLLTMLSPVSHGRTAAEVEVYRTEPYVIAADVYGVAPHVGRGGWTWYTGSAGWMYRVALESVLGFQLDGGDRIVLRPCIPAAWPGFTVRYRLPGSETTYEIAVARGSEGAGTTVQVNGVVGDGMVRDGAVVLPIVRDGASHRVEVVLGRDVGQRYAPTSSAEGEPAE